MKCLCVCRLLVLLKSQDQETQICKKNLNKTPIICASSLDFYTSVLHMHRGWNMHMHSAPKHTNSTKESLPTRKYLCTFRGLLKI